MANACFYLIGTGKGITPVYDRLRTVYVLPLLLVATTFAVTSGSTKQSLQYLFPMLPALAVLGSLAADAFPGVTRRWILPLMIVTLTAWNWNAGIKFLNPSSTHVVESWIYENIPEGAPVAVDWAYIPRLFSEDQLTELSLMNISELSGRLVTHIRQTRPLYDIQAIEYESSWLSSTESEWLVTSSGCYSRFLEHGLFTRIIPGADTALGAEYEERRQFYKALFESQSWMLRFESDTGNGPRTLVFVRN